MYYENTLADIRSHFGVSQECAKYIFHRVIRHRKKDEKYIEWTLQLQNALVKADKCLGLNWDSLIFGKEEEQLATHGIHLKEMENTVFKWTADTSESDDEWTTVKKKRKPKKFTNNLSIYV